MTFFVARRIYNSDGRYNEDGYEDRIVQNFERLADAQNFRRSCEKLFILGPNEEIVVISEE